MDTYFDDNWMKAKLKFEQDWHYNGIESKSRADNNNNTLIKVGVKGGKPTCVYKSRMFLI